MRISWVFVALVVVVTAMFPSVAQTSQQPIQSDGAFLMWKDVRSKKGVSGRGLYLVRTAAGRSRILLGERKSLKGSGRMVRGVEGTLSPDGTTVAVKSTVSLPKQRRRELIETVDVATGQRTVVRRVVHSSYGGNVEYFGDKPVWKTDSTTFFVGASSGGLACGNATGSCTTESVPKTDRWDSIVGWHSELGLIGSRQKDSSHSEYRRRSLGLPTCKRRSPRALGPAHVEVVAYGSSGSPRSLLTNAASFPNDPSGQSISWFGYRSLEMSTLPVLAAGAIYSVDSPNLKLARKFKNCAGRVGTLRQSMALGQLRLRSVTSQGTKVIQTPSELPDGKLASWIVPGDSVPTLITDRYSIEWRMVTTVPGNDATPPPTSPDLATYHGVANGRIYQGSNSKIVDSQVWRYDVASNQLARATNLSAKTIRMVGAGPMVSGPGSSVFVQDHAQSSRAEDAIYQVWLDGSREPLKIAYGELSYLKG